MLFTTVILFFMALAALLFSSKKVVNAVTRVSVQLNLSPFFIALTLVSIGTSLPELTTAIISSLKHLPTIPLGNILGANIANIGLTIGLASILFAVDIKKKSFQQDATIALLVAVGTFIIALDGALSQNEGLLMLFLFVCYMVRLVKSQHPMVKEVLTKKNGSAIHPVLNILILLVFLAVLGVSAKYLVSSVIDIASELGIANEIVALTVLSLGTTVPELSVTLAAAKTKKPEVALGTIVGSNIINILLILGLTAVIAPIPISPFIITIAFPVLILLTLLLYRYVHGNWFTKVIDGILLLLLYAIFLILLVIMA